MAQEFSQPTSSGGFPLDLFLNQEHAKPYLCPICHKVCRNVVQLNCNEGHTFCNDCISSEPHTRTTTENVYYDANNKSNQLMVNEDYSNQTQIKVSTSNTTCPVCQVSRCSKITCPLITETISSLSIHCTNQHYGCRWQGTLSQLGTHSQTNCVTATCNCLFHVFGCPATNIPKEELGRHLQSSQMEHLHLQINAIIQLQAGYQHMQQQIQAVNTQQVHLTALISEYDEKLKWIGAPPNVAPNVAQNGLAPSQQNLQFNINMNHGKNEEKEDYHRWKHNPILNMMSSMQKQIVSTQSAITTVDNIKKIAHQYNLAELSELFTNINRGSNYLPTFHKKLLVLRGSVTKNSKHHSIMAFDLHNKTKYKLLYDDPIAKYPSWDTEFAALTVIHNIPAALFERAVYHPKEQMLFALKHGLNIKQYQYKNKQDLDKYMRHRDDYLQLKFNEEQKKNDNAMDMAATHCSVLLRCGGSIISDDTKTGTTNRVNGLILNTGDWISCLPNLKTERYGATALYSQNNGVLVIGGKNDRSSLDTVEGWSIGKGDVVWESLPPMNAKRYSPCAVCHSSKKTDECLFVGGGWNEKDKVLRSCEIYDFTNSFWRNVASMKEERYGAGCCTWNHTASGNKIVVGGGASKNAAKSVEQYDIYKDKWYSLPNTNATHRNSPSLWVCKEYGKFLSPFNGMLCIAGDKWDNDKRNGAIKGFIEMYDPREWRQQWFIVEDLRNILSNNKNAVVRGMIPFS